MDRFLPLLWYYKCITIVLFFSSQKWWSYFLWLLNSCIFDLSFLQGTYINATMVYGSHQLFFLRIFCKSSYVKISHAESSFLSDVSRSSSHPSSILNCLIVVNKSINFQLQNSQSGVIYSSALRTATVGSFCWFNFVLNNFNVHFVHFNMETETLDGGELKK